MTRQNDLVLPWLASCGSDAIRRDYGRFVRDFLTRLRIDPRKATAEQVEAVVAQWATAKKPTAGTYNKYLQGVRSFFRHVWRAEGLRFNPAEGLRDAAPTQPRIPTHAEVQRIWSALLSARVWEASGHIQRLRICRDRALFFLLAELGLRSQEIRRVTVGDVSFDPAQLRVQFIANERLVAYQSEHTNLLRPVTIDRAADAALVLNDLFRPITGSELSHRVRALCREVKVQAYTASEFRAYVATTVTRRLGPQRARQDLGIDRLSNTTRFLAIDEAAAEPPELSTFHAHRA